MSGAIMDSARFDALARSLSEGMTRRGLTRLLGGLTLGLLGPLPVAAKKGGTGTTRDDGTGKQDGTGTKRRTGKGSGKPGTAEHETDKAGRKRGKTGTGKTDTDDGKHGTQDTAETSRGTDGGNKKDNAGKTGGAGTGQGTGKTDTAERETRKAERETGKAGPKPVSIQSQTVPSVFTAHLVVMPIAMARSSLNCAIWLGGSGANCLISQHQTVPSARSAGP
jgi:hypothetical protein